MSNICFYQSLLEKWLKKTNKLTFIANDPITIPHRFSNKQDIEISGFFAAIMAWGNRTTIIKKCSELMDRMDNAPYDFLTSSNQRSWAQLEGFVHRTMNDTDILYLSEFLRNWYKKHDSLEPAFGSTISKTDLNVRSGLEGFHELVFSGNTISERTRKHIATPKRKSACKRLNMYLRWMVRDDDNGVDFGLWKSINTAQLVCPLDVHVQKVALELGLLKRKISDWRAAEELTEALKVLDPTDPVKYDYALFGLGISKTRNKKNPVQ